MYKILYVYCGATGKENDFTKTKEKKKKENKSKI